MTIATKPDPAAPESLILEIATRHFFVETLETRNSDQLDFHDVAVWAMRAALEDAYEAGRIAGAKAMLMYPMGPSRRRLLYQSTHFSVSHSTSRIDFHGPI